MVWHDAFALLDISATTLTLDRWPPMRTQMLLGLIDYPKSRKVTALLTAADVGNAAHQRIAAKRGGGE